MKNVTKLKKLELPAFVSCDHSDLPAWKDALNKNHYKLWTWLYALYRADGKDHILYDSRHVCKGMHVSKKDGEYIASRLHPNDLGDKFLTIDPDVPEGMYFIDFDTMNERIGTIDWVEDYPIAVEDYRNGN